jgi:signal peptidase I
LLSAACPGAGHLTLGQLPKGMVLSSLFVILLCGFWPLRLPRYYAAYMTLVLSWFVIGLYSACSAQLVRNPKTGNRASKWWFLLTLPVAVVTICLTFAGVTLSAGFRNFTIPSTSMEPTIQRGDHIVIDTRAFRLSAPQYRDVIVCYKDGLFVVKRIIAMSGDTIEGRTDSIIVNGSLINESYAQHSRARSGVDWQALGYDDETQSFGPVRVPVDKYFVMGDNRDVSIDSRSTNFGFVDRGSIVGKVLYVYSTGREGARVR